MALTEVLINDFTTTLTADITATDTAIPVAAMPVGFDATKQTRIRIESEWILVTFTDSTHLAVVGGVAGRGVEQSTAASHVATTEVDFVATTAGMTGALVSSGGGGGGMANPMTTLGDLIYQPAVTDLALDKTCTSESNFVDAGYLPQNLVDGSPTTWWASAAGHVPTWVVVDLVTPQTVMGYRVVERNDAVLNQYVLQGSDDNATWVDVAVDTAHNADHTASITPTTYRYWRLYIASLSGAAAGLAILNTFEIHASFSAPQRLAVGAEGQVLTVKAGLPAWGPPGAAGGADAAWHVVGAAGEPPFLNGWQGNVAPPNYPEPRFRKDANGLVRLGGLAQSGAAGQAIFQLPLGYAPGEILTVPSFDSGSGTFKAVTLFTSGAGTPRGVMAPTPYSGWVSLDAIAFFAVPG